MSLRLTALISLIPELRVGRWGEVSLRLETWGKLETQSHGKNKRVRIYLKEWLSASVREGRQRAESCEGTGEHREWGRAENWRMNRVENWDSLGFYYEVQTVRFAPFFFFFEFQPESAGLLVQLESVCFGSFDRYRPIWRKSAQVDA